MDGSSVSVSIASAATQVRDVQDLTGVDPAELGFGGYFRGCPDYGLGSSEGGMFQNILQAYCHDTPSRN